MKTLAKYNVCNHCVIGEKTFKNILIGPGNLPGLSRNGPLIPYGPVRLFFRGGGGEARGGRGTLDLLSHNIISQRRIFSFFAF